MASPRRYPHPHQHQRAQSLAPPPPLPNWSQTPTPATTMTVQLMPAPQPLGLPEQRDVFGPRPPSKNNNNNNNRRGRLPAHGAISDNDSESGDEEPRHAHEPWGDRQQYQSYSPQRAASPTMAVLTSTFTNISSMVSGSVMRTSPQQQQRMPTDEELEMEAERAREASRMEAERILAMERAQTAGELERQTMEAEVLRLLSTPSSGPASNKSPRANPSAPASPHTPSKQSSPNPSWWTAAKQRLTPTKDTIASNPNTPQKDLTPAQQIVQETRTAKLRKSAPSPSPSPIRGLPSIFGGSRERVHDVERAEGGRMWPASASSKFDDPAFINLASAQGQEQGQGQQGRMSMDDHRSTTTAATNAHDTYGRTRTQSLPPPQTPQRSPQTQHLGPPTTPAHRPNPSPQPSMTGASPAPSFTASARSPYLSHTASGGLDLPSSVTSMAGRLEKLEKWTVAHVRALEERMREVEEYIVGREGGWDEVERVVDGLKAGVGELRAGLGSGTVAAGAGGWNVDWPHPNPHNLEKDLHTKSSAIERVVTSVKPPPSAPAALLAPQAGEVEVASVVSGQTGRETLTGLADTLTDYSRMFLAKGGEEGEGGDVSRMGSLARSVGSTDTEASSGSSVPHELEHDAGSEKSSNLPVTPTFEMDAHSHDDGIEMLEKERETLPGETDTDTPRSSRLPRPTGDYVEDGLATPSPGVSPRIAQAQAREVLEAPPARESDRASPNGRRRYTSALGGTGLAGRKGVAGSGWTTVALASGDKPSAPSSDKEKAQPLLPTPDTPGTATFTPSPSPAKPTTHRPTHSLTSPAPAPQFFSTTRPRPRPASTLPAPLSQQSPAPIKIPPPRRAVGRGLGFVDPLVVKGKMGRAGGAGAGGEEVGRKAAREKVPVGQLVKFFDAAMD